MLAASSAKASEVMKRTLGSLIGALLGSTLGYTAHQFMMSDDSTKETDLTVGAPLTTTLLAFGVGLLGGRRAPVVAFVVGAVAGAVLGTRLNELLPIGQSLKPSSTNSLQSSA